MHAFKAHEHGRSTEIPAMIPLRGSLAHACSDCGTSIGQRCRKFRIDRGVRLYVIGYKAKPCAARRSADGLA